MTTLQGIVPDLDEKLYHAHTALSSTGARQLLASPARFRYSQDHPQKPKAEFDLGTAVHSKVLGVGAPTVAIPEEFLAVNGAASTAKAKRFIALARSHGMTPVKAAVARQVDAMAEAVLADAPALFEQPGAIPEASLFATDPATGVELRARFDMFAPVGVDLKTSAKLVTPTKWAFTVFDLGYDVQQEHYQYLRLLIEGERRPFVFVAVETEPPYLVGQYQLDRDFVEIGTAKARRARELYAACLESGHWPRYPNEIQLLKPPMPAVYDFEDHYAS